MTDTSRHFSPRATLAAIGLKIRAIDLLAPLKEKVKVAQKTIKHEPIEKLQDALITILAGAHGLSEIKQGYAQIRLFSAPSGGHLAPISLWFKPHSTPALPPMSRR